jgi:ATP synthase I chain
MTPMTKPEDRLTLIVAGFGSLISLGSLALGGAFIGMSTAIGAALALVNLVVLRSIVVRVVAGDIHRKLPLLALVFVKMGVFMLLVYQLIVRHWVEPIAFTVGFSSLVVGLIAGSLFAARARHPSPPAN